MEQQYKTDSEIYAVLEREIIDLTLRPGCSLSENPLCTRFGAPRSLIRVVLQRLQENGLVKIVPYKGTTVTRLNRDIVDELIYERIAVEARVLRDFAPHCTPEHRALIRQRAAAYDELAKAETLDFNRLYEADTRLHETWFSAMGKMYLWRTLQNAHADYSRFRMLDTLTTGGLAEVVADADFGKGLHQGLEGAFAEIEERIVDINQNRIKSHGSLAFSFFPVYHISGFYDILISLSAQRGKPANCRGAAAKGEPNEDNHTAAGRRAGLQGRICE